MTRRERFIRVLSLRDEGKTFSQIGRELKLSPQRAYQLFRDARLAMFERNYGFPFDQTWTPEMQALELRYERPEGL